VWSRTTRSKISSRSSGRMRSMTKEMTGMGKRRPDPS
jgi:hypothetical protein